MNNSTINISENYNEGDSININSQKLYIINSSFLLFQYYIS